ncbi:hypothetical protein [Methanolobus sp. WCC4]|uniref:hypothetical protein n=1 Tax=Methanolobus sp. WCC4 TaxID=3125784 RepID=UPI0030F7015E
MKINRMHVFAGIIIFMFLVLVARMPMELSGADMPDNSTNTTKEDENEGTSLMSSPDNPSTEEKKGWWKHTGHSSVSHSNDDQGSGSSGEGATNNDKNEVEEIPEFPFIAIPVFIVICIAMIISRK